MMSKRQNNTVSVSPEARNTAIRFGLTPRKENSTYSIKYYIDEWGVLHGERSSALAANQSFEDASPTYSADS